MAEFGFDPCTKCGFSIYHNREKRPAETLLCVGSCTSEPLPYDGFSSRTPIGQSRGTKLAKPKRERVNSYAAALERAASTPTHRPPGEENETMTTEPVTDSAVEEPDLGLDGEDEALTDEAWEDSATDSPESDALNDEGDESDDLEADEAEVEADQPTETADESDEDEDADEDEEVEEKPKPKSKKGGKGKDKEKPKRARTKNARERGALEHDVRLVVQDFDAGKLALDEGQTLTPHRIARLIQDKDGLEKPPSTGAVTNVLRKMEDMGFALTHDTPFAFKRISAKGKKEGYDTLSEKLAERKRAERAKERESKKK